jgi:hypothetical protein
MTTPSPQLQPSKTPVGQVVQSTAECGIAGHETRVKAFPGVRGAKNNGGVAGLAHASSDEFVTTWVRFGISSGKLHCPLGLHWVGC